MEGKVSFEEIRQILDSEGEGWMSNQNWDYIAIKEDDEYNGGFFEVGAYDLALEKERLRRKNLEIIENIYSDFSVSYKIDLTLNTRRNPNFVDDGTKLSLWFHYVTGRQKTKTKKDKSYQSSWKISQGSEIALKANYDENPGKLGALMSLKFSSDKYLITAGHVIENQKASILPKCRDKITSPAVFPQESDIHDIGELVYYRKDDFVDAAIVKITKKNRIGRPIVFLSSKPSNSLVENQKIQIVSNNKIKKGLIKSLYCYSRRIGGCSGIMKETIMTNDRFGENGDSGSIVLNENNTPVGLLIKKAEYEGNNFFIRLNFLAEEMQSICGIHSLKFKEFINS